MKESITKFDLEAAFKALDEIEAPKAEKIQSNRAPLTEIFSRKSKFDALMEEYYDINSNEGLENAKEAREAEIAQAKLARIEKIVDLDAESADDLLTSYVGKFIIQCPQCMTLFYKDEADIEASEDNPSTVNVNEVCQHCGNESGYALIGKVGTAEPEEAEEATTEEDEELDLEIEEDEAEEDATEEDAAEEETEEAGEEDLEDLDFDAELADLELEDEEEKKEESFNVHEGQLLTEEVDFDVTADEFEQLMNSSEFKKPISDSAVRTMLAMEESDKAEEEAEAEVLAEELPAKEMVFGKEPETVEAETEEVVSDEAEEDVADETEEDVEVEESLKEGIFDKIREKGASLKNTLDKALDKVVGQLSTRKDIADWVLANALTAKGYTEISNADPNKLDPENLFPETPKANPECQFTHYITIGYEDRAKNFDQKFSKAPRWDSKMLVPIADKNKAFKSYAGAESFAINESTAGGPVSIFFANKKDKDKIAFICMFFEGKVVAESDQLTKYFETVKQKIRDIKPAAQRAQTAAEDEITDDDEFFDESLDAVFSDIEELKENVLENMISDSLIEAYGNVAGFRIKECICQDNKFMIEGDIHFTSGKTRKTTYVFTEAISAGSKITLRGLNEKLGLDNQFTIIGYNENKTFITESFNTVRK